MNTISRAPEIRIDMPDSDAQSSVDVVRRAVTSSITIDHALYDTRLAPAGVGSANLPAFSMANTLSGVAILATESEGIAPPDGFRILPPGTVEVLPGTPSVSGPVRDVGGRGGNDATNVSPNLVPTDPLYADQWHFQLMANGGTLASTIETIWNEFDGSGINVGVYDSGVQSIHHDMNDNYNAALHVVVGGNTLPGDPIANPPAADFHGTAVAGIIGAELNGSGGVGVAWDTNLTGVNIFDPNSPAFINAPTPTGFLDAVNQMAKFDVTNNSWGSTPVYSFSFQSLANASSFDANVIAGYQFAAQTGRGGLGTNVVQSGGNDNIDGNGSGINASRYTITVNALLENGSAASYSSFGANTLVSAPGGDTGNPPVNGTRRITTTDLLGTDGFNTFADPTGAQDFTDRMNGTSAAAPMVSGVIALMLDANPNLGWRDVQNILSATAFHTGSAIGAPTLGLNENHFWYINDANTVNGGGMHFNEDYGYGNVDPFSAVRVAESYAIIGKAARTSANEVSAVSAVLPVNLTPADAQPGTPVTFQFNFAQNVSIEHVAFNINYTSTDIQDLRIILTSAEGTQVVMQTEEFQRTTGFSNQSWVYGVDALRGELSAGSWTLSFSDNFAGDSTTINSLQMTVFGSTPSVDDVYTYTDEYKAMQALDGARGTLADTNGGSDWINMAALSILAGTTVLNLNAGTASTVNSTPFTIAAGTVIENAITGDGDDQLIGNASINRLAGARGNDTYTVQNAGDVVIEGVGQGTADRVKSTVDYVLASGVEVEQLTTTSSSGTSGIDLTGNALAQEIVGNYGVNILRDGGGAGDNLKGLLGNDTYQIYSSKTTIVESTSDTADRVAAAVDYVLAAGVQIEIMTTNGAGGTSGIDLTGNALKQSITGNAGNNILHDGGVGAADTMTGLGGDDTYRVFNAGDVIVEINTGGAADRVTSAVDYKLGSGVFVEIMTTNGASGTSGIDLTGNENIQAITGNAGTNILDGKAGKDTLAGLGGSDFFVFSTTLAASNVDAITDFNVTADTIRLENAIFTALTATGILASAAFRSNLTGLAQDADDRIIYETDTGELYYDANGNASGGGVLFATITAGLAVTNADFVVI